MWLFKNRKNRRVTPLPPPASLGSGGTLPPRAPSVSFTKQVADNLPTDVLRHYIYPKAVSNYLRDQSKGMQAGLTFYPLMAGTQFNPPARERMQMSAVPQEAKGRKRSVATEAGEFKKGGKVKKTGVAKLHKGEVVVPAHRVETVDKALKKAGLKPLKK
jgi:hypothetical protein